MVMFFLSAVSLKKDEGNNKNSVILLSKMQKNTKSINPMVSKTSNGKTMILSKCAVCNTRNSLESTRIIS